MHDDSQGLARQSSDLILQFGEQLAAQQTYEEQEGWLIAFLKEQFQADSQIWLKPSTKFQLTKSRDEKAVLPIAPDSFDLHAKLAEDGFCALQVNQIHWLVLPLEYGSLDMGLIILNREEAFTNDQLQYPETHQPGDQFCHFRHPTNTAQSLAPKTARPCPLRQ